MIGMSEMNLDATECCFCKRGSTTGGAYYRRPSGEWAFHCWEDDCCAKGNAESEERHQNEIRDLKAAGKCWFLEAWIGFCKVDAKDGFCDKHRKELCWVCKKQAIQNCDHTGFLVCGMPFCSEHPHKH